MTWFSRKPYRVRLTKVLSCIVYEAGGRKMLIDSEPIPGSNGLVAYAATMRWQSPDSGEGPSDEERARATKDIAEGLAAWNIQWK